jgi:hypothetical protein
LNSANKENPIVQYTLEEGAKCVCFCSQGLGRQQKCHHAMSDDVDIISSIIEE